MPSTPQGSEEHFVRLVGGAAKAVEARVRKLRPTGWSGDEAADAGVRMTEERQRRLMADDANRASERIVPDVPRTPEPSASTRHQIAAESTARVTILSKRLLLLITDNRASPGDDVPTL